MDLSDRKLHMVLIIEELAEVILLALFYYAAWQYYVPYVGQNLFAFRGKFVLMGIYAILIYIVFHGCDSFNIGNLKTTDAIVSQCISVLIVNAVTYLQVCLIANAVVTPVPMLILTAADWVAAGICVFIFTKIYHHNYVKRNMIMIYGSENALELADKFGRQKDKYNIAELVPYKIGIKEIKEKISKYDAVIINDVPISVRNEVLKYCYEHDIRLYMAPELTDVILRGTEEINLFDTPLMLTGESGLMPEQAIAKRVLDLLVAVIALIPCAVIIVIVGAAILIEDGGPIFYKQTRVTLNNKQFGMLKFRSMIVNAEKNTGAVLAAEDDPRITKVGRFLRRHRLDEIPQIINVLSGSMSIVGPRPERPEIMAEIIKDMPEFAYRTKVKGGITGYAQVYGKYNTMPYDKLKYDMMYIEKYSLLLDIKLVLMTPQILLRKESTEGVKR